MSKYYILIVGIFSLILGVFIGKIFYEKEDIQISRIENIKKDENLAINQNIIEERESYFKRRVTNIYKRRFGVLLNRYIKFDQKRLGRFFIYDKKR